MRSTLSPWTLQRRNKSIKINHRNYLDLNFEALWTFLIVKIQISATHLYAPGFRENRNTSESPNTSNSNTFVSHRVSHSHWLFTISLSLFVFNEVENENVLPGFRISSQLQSRDELQAVWIVYLLCKKWNSEDKKLKKLSRIKLKIDRIIWEIDQRN